MTVSYSTFRSLLIVLIMVFAKPSFADEPSGSDVSSRTKPLWELRLFNSIVRLPLYRGAGKYKVYFLPLPYLIYRGQHFQSDRGGIRGVFFRSEFLETTLSFFGNPPVDDEDTAREGMGDLDPIIEAGPALKWFFLGRHPRKYLYLRSALRWTASVGLPDNLKSRYQGWRFLVNLIYQYDAPWDNDRWKFGFNMGVDFADQRYNGYFYDVPEKNALPDRPAYKTNGGYGGLMFSGSLTYHINERFSTVIYGRWDSLAGAVYRDSPLVEEKNNFIGAAALIWNVTASKRQVDARYQEN